MKKRFGIALVLLVLFSSYKPQKLFLINKFNIKEIKIENNIILKDLEIKKKIDFLYEKNLIFLKNENIKTALRELTFIESFEIKKIYPDKIKIKIFEKKPIAILQNKKKKFYINKKVDLINYTHLENYENLPIIFGNKESFKVLYDNLKKINFPVNEIKIYYLYDSKRWDLETHENKVIKLPYRNYNESLENFMNLRKKKNYGKYKVFDYRVKNQLILK